MIRKHRFSTSQRLAFWILVFLVVWQVLKQPPIFDAMIKFCLAGVVPGTGVVLTPDAILRGVAVLLAVIVTAFVARPLLRELLYILRPARIDPAIGLSTAADTTDNSAVGAEIPAADISQAETSTAEIIGPIPLEHIAVPESVKPASASLPSWAQATITIVQRAAKHAAHVTQQSAHLTYQALRTGAVRAKPYVRRMYVAVRAYCVLSSRWIARQAKIWWHRAEPQLHRFDAWLEVQYVTVSKKAARKTQQYATLITLREMGRESKQAIAKADLKTKATIAKQKVVPYAKKAKQAAKTTKRKAHTATKKVARKARGKATPS